MLVNLLSPWLKVKPTIKAPAVANDQQTQTTHLPDIDQEELFIEHSINSIDLNSDVFPAFDMSVYTQNQGTVELAFYMLDEYVESNQQHFQQLLAGIEHQKMAEIKVALSGLQQNAKILAAKEVDTLCMQLDKVLVNISDSTSTDIGNNSELGVLVSEMDNALEKVALYAEAI